MHPPKFLGDVRAASERCGRHHTECRRGPKRGLDNFKKKKIDVPHGHFEGRGSVCGALTLIRVRVGRAVFLIEVFPTKRACPVTIVVEETYGLSCSREI